MNSSDISTFGLDFFEKFDAVVVSCCSLAKKKKVLANLIPDASYSLKWGRRTSKSTSI
ncbi:hypothetical protein V6N11_050713 [Hibiscus sabdariffa]|uniref:Uncharacterized protein n=1 Tax=Hibiscus sabdariffa TaxID=183260 RepID=A0ABR2TBF1_9ROSI